MTCACGLPALYSDGKCTNCYRRVWRKTSLSHATTTASIKTFDGPEVLEILRTATGLDRSEIAQYIQAKREMA